MHAGIALCLCAAGFGTSPASTLNQPRPQTAQPTTSSVVPASHVVVDDDVTVIPPAPLPEFTDVESPQILFEFSRPESCTDSQVCPPAPPAELEMTESPRPNGRGPYRYKAHVGSVEATVIAFDEPEFESPLNATAGEPIQLARPEHPTTIDQLHHLHTAIQHLQAAGLQQSAQTMQEQYRDAISRLRVQIEEAIDAKQAEVKRLTEEISRLKVDLVGDASLEFQVEHFAVDMIRLPELVTMSTGEMQQAAKFVLDHGVNGVAPKDHAEDMAKYRAALEFLAKNSGHVQCLGRPVLRTLNGQETEMFQGTAVPGIQGENSQTVGTRLKVHGEIQPDGTIAARLDYECKHADQSNERSRVQTNLQLTPGQTVCLGGMRTASEVTNSDGTRLQRDEARQLLITPTIIRSDKLTVGTADSGQPVRWQRERQPIEPVNQEIVHGLHQPPKKNQVHDVITIVVHENGEAIKNSRFYQLGKFDHQETAARFPAMIESFLPSRLPTIGMTANTKGIAHKIGATVVDILPNGTLVLEARKMIHTDHKVFQFRLTGRVDPSSISENRTVNSDKITDLKITHSQPRKVYSAGYSELWNDQRIPVVSNLWNLYRTFTQPITPLSAETESEYAVPLPILPAPAPFQLIPSPQTGGRPQLLFPLAPMRSVEESPQKPEFQLPPAPISEEAEADDSDNGPVV